MSVVHINNEQHIAVLMLNTQFPRLFGDIGNANTFNGRVKYYCVENAKVNNVVDKNIIAKDITDAFIQKAQLAESEGARVILTSCGFLIAIQDALVDAVNIPVFASSLVLLPELIAQYGENSVAIITADATKLNKKHFAALSISNGSCRVYGMENMKEFKRIILEDNNRITNKKNMHDDIEKEVLILSQQILKKQPHVKVLLLECTNLSPYKKAVEQYSGKIVYDICSFIQLD